MTTPAKEAEHGRGYDCRDRARLEDSVVGREIGGTIGEALSRQRPGWAKELSTKENARIRAAEVLYVVESRRAGRPQVDGPR